MDLDFTQAQQDFRAEVRAWLEANAKRLDGTAYLCVLSRKPAEAEAEYFLNRLRDGKRKRELEDLFWVLLNSTEFSWNH